MNQKRPRLRMKGVHSVNIHGDWTQYTDAIPSGGVPLGTIKVRDAEGALIRAEMPDEDGIRYLLINREGFFFTLNPRKVRAALHQAGMTEPSDPLVQEPPLSAV